MKKRIKKIKNKMLMKKIIERHKLHKIEKTWRFKIFKVYLIKL